MDWTLASLASFSVWFPNCRNFWHRTECTRRVPGRSAGGLLLAGGVENPMQDIGIKIAIFLAVVIAAITSIPLLAQEAGAGAQASAAASAASATGARQAAGYGDEAASHAWEMSSITGELEGKLDSKTAKPGDPVMLKTIEKAQTSDGTIIPKGSRMLGHVTQVQAYSKEHGAALLGIAFDRVEMKNGKNVAMYMLIRGVSPAASVMAMNSMDSGGMMDPSMSGGAPMGGARWAAVCPWGAVRQWVVEVESARRLASLAER